MIVGMMRIRNEARWIARVLRSMLPICERIFIMDDHSEDDTAKICRSFHRVEVLHSPFSGLDETRDKNWLLEHVSTSGAKWVLCIDGDEEIAPGDEAAIVRLTQNDEPFGAYRFRIVYLWDREDQIRVDGIYRNFTRASFFRFNPERRFKSTTAGGFHCGNVPAGMRSISEADVRLLHYGYLYKEDRIRKWEFYNSHDPKNQAEGYDVRWPERRSYPHIVQGDVPEVPADARLTHAGPLRLVPNPIIMTAAV